MVMDVRIVAPLAGWNVRGYSYGELQPDGQRHPGADLNVGYGDEDLGLPVVCFADGVVAERVDWDGRSYGFGNAGLVEHRLFGQDGEAASGSESGTEGVRLWSLYAHLDSFDGGFVPGARLAAGQRIGACGKSGGQTWAHLHFELRYKGLPDMAARYWGGRLSYEAQSARYADPYTVLRLLEGLELGSSSAARGVDGERVEAACPEAERCAVVWADRDYNYRLKMLFEGTLRELEAKRRLKRGTTERLIAQV